MSLLTNLQHVDSPVTPYSTANSLVESSIFKHMSEVNRMQFGAESTYIHAYVYVVHMYKYIHIYL